MKCNPFSSHLDLLVKLIRPVQDDEAIGQLIQLWALKRPSYKPCLTQSWIVLTRMGGCYDAIEKQYVKSTLRCCLESLVDSFFLAEENDSSGEISSWMSDVSGWWLALGFSVCSSCVRVKKMQRWEVVLSMCIVLYQRKIYYFLIVEECSFWFSGAWLLSVDYWREGLVDDYWLVQ